MTRRSALQGADGAAGAGGVAAPPMSARSQGAPLQLGVLTPLTGAGGNRRAAHAARRCRRSPGGERGRRRARPQDRVRRRGRPDQPRGRGARRTQADRRRQGAGHHGHLGVRRHRARWRRSAGSARPSCITVSGADSITLLPHQGFLVRTQPTSKLQARAHAEFIPSHRRQARLRHRRPGAFALPTQEQLADVLKPQGGSELVGHTHLREGQDHLPLGDRPGAAGQAGLPLPQRLCARHRPSCCATCTGPASRRPHSPQSYAVTAEDARDAAARGDRGRLHGAALGRHHRTAFELAAKRLGMDEPGLLRVAGERLGQPRLLTIAKAKEATGDGMRENVRKISQGRRPEGLQRRRRAEGARRGQGDQLRGRLRPVRLHRHRRHRDCRFRYRA